MGQDVARMLAEKMPPSEKPLTVVTFVGKGIQKPLPQQSDPPLVSPSRQNTKHSHRKRYGSWKGKLEGSDWSDHRVRGNWCVSFNLSSELPKAERQ